jgi:adenylate cyclase
LESSTSRPQSPIGSCIPKQQFEASIAEFELAIGLNPNFSHFYYAMTLVLAGEPARAIEVVKAHTRLDPFYEPLAPFMLGMALYLLGNYSEAISPFRETVLRAPKFMQGRVWLAATHAQLGQLEEARGEAAEALAILPTYTIPTTSLFKHPSDAKHFCEGLRKAGLPE